LLLKEKKDEAVANKRRLAGRRKKSKKNQRTSGDQKGRHSLRGAKGKGEKIENASQFEDHHSTLSRAKRRRNKKRKAHNLFMSAKDRNARPRGGAKDTESTTLQEYPAANGGCRTPCPPSTQGFPNPGGQGEGKRSVVMS